MRSLVLLIAGAITCACCLVAGICRADETQAPKQAPYNLGETPSVTIKTPPKPISIDLDLEAEMTFAYGPEPSTVQDAPGKSSSVTLREVPICPPPEVRLIWIDSKCGMIVLEEEIDIKAGQAVGRQLVLNGHLASDDTLNAYDRLLYWYHYLTFEPGDYPFVAKFKYNRAGSTDTQFIEREFSVPLRPPLAVVVVGASFGALLLALFLLAMGFWNRDSNAKSSHLELIGRAAGILAIGAISAVIFVILTFRLKSDTLPISITVNDFYGGVVIGLFTFKISNWLYVQLAKQG